MERAEGLVEPVDVERAEGLVEPVDVERAEGLVEPVDAERAGRLLLLPRIGKRDMQHYTERDWLDFWGTGALAVVIILAGSWITIVGQPRWENASEIELKSFEPKVELGACTEDVRALFDSQGHEHIWWDSSFSPYHAIRTHPKAGAYNWILWMEERQGRIVGVRIRQWKHYNIHPGEAPEDRFDAAASQWPEGLDYISRY